MKRIGLYILKCNNGRYYVGSTNDFNRRIFEHQNGFVKSTSHILPVELVFFQSCDNVEFARKLEYELKRKKSKKIIERIIKDGNIGFMRV